MLTIRIKYDVMLNERFYATLTSTIPYKLYDNGGVKSQRKSILMTSRKMSLRDYLL